MKIELKCRGKKVPAMLFLFEGKVWLIVSGVARSAVVPCVNVQLGISNALHLAISNVLMCKWGEEMTYEDILGWIKDL